MHGAAVFVTGKYIQLGGTWMCLLDFEILTSAIPTFVPICRCHHRSTHA